MWSARAVHACGAHVRCARAVRARVQCGGAPRDRWAAHLPRIEQSVELLVHARVEGVDLRLRCGLVHGGLQRLEGVDERQQTPHRLDPANLVLARQLGARLLPEALEVRRQQEVPRLACGINGRALATRR
eukprot:scaffold129929_cov57-Phaeocystis_antarctica.AAC.4